MDFRRLPSNRTLPRSRSLAAGFALLLLSAPVVQAEPLAQIGSSFDEAGRALNRQIGDWVGAPAKPRAATRRRALPATAPLPPIRPAEFAAETPAAQTPAPEVSPAPPVAAAAPLPPPEPQPQPQAEAPRIAAAPAIPAPPSAREEMRLAARPAVTPPEKPVAAPEPAAKVASDVPLPPVRPSGAPEQAEAPPAKQRLATLPPAAAEIAPADKAGPTAESVPTICPELSNGDIGVFEPSVVTATNPLCTVDRGVTLSAVRMKDGRLVTLSPAATLRCQMAASVAVWLREKVEPVVATLGAPLDKVEVAASQQCRPRNRVAGAKISEHGRGNAIDIGGFVLKDGRSFVIGRPSAGALAMPLDFQDRLKLSACADFTTILGPGSDGYHEQHLHLDRAERRSGAVLCQWATARIEAVVPRPPAKPAPEPAKSEDDAPEPAASDQ